MHPALHYIYDPLCGWCYGAEPLVTAAAGVDGLALELHAGALWPEPTRLPAETRAYIEQADARIASMSGQPFGQAYLTGLLRDPELVLESRPTIAAVLAAQSLGAPRALPMLRAIQHAHYEHGRHVGQRDVLVDLAAGIGLDGQAFEAALSQAPVDEHIAESRALMARVGARGFPTFVLETGGEWRVIPNHRFAGAPAAFRSWLAGAAAGRVQSAEA